MMRTAAKVIEEAYGSKAVGNFDEVCAIESADRRDLDHIIHSGKWANLEFPYYAPSHPQELLPTLTQIKTAMKRSSFARRSDFSNVCRIAENMLFVEQFPQIRSPKLYAAYSVNREEEGVELRPMHYLVTEYIENDNIDWYNYLKLPEAAQKLYTTRLGEQLRALRSIPSEGYYGRVNKQPFAPDLAPFRIRYQHFHGPFESFYDIVDAMYSSTELRCAEKENLRTSITKLRNAKQQNRAQQQTLPEWDPVIAAMLEDFKPIIGRTKGNKPVLTIMFPTMTKFLAKAVRDNDGEIVDWKITLTDWMDLGWYPAFLQAHVLGCWRSPHWGEEGKKFYQRMKEYICEEDFDEALEYLHNRAKGFRIN